MPPSLQTDEHARARGQCSTGVLAAKAHDIRQAIYQRGQLLSGQLVAGETSGVSSMVAELDGVDLRTDRLFGDTALCAKRIGVWGENIIGSELRRR